MKFRHLVLLFIFIAGTAIGLQATEKNSTETKILELVNQHRAAHNLPPLQLIEIANKAAEEHSKNMARKKVDFGHAGFDQRIDGLMTKIKGASAAAENVAYGPQEPEKVVNMWLNSRGHKKNIEGNFNLTGIGIAYDENQRPYYTQIFINRK